MVSARKKKQSNRKLLSQLNNFDRKIIIGNAVSDRQQNVAGNERTIGRVLTASDDYSYLAANENVINVQTLERCLNERNDREIGDIVDTVEDWNQNAILNPSDNIVTARVELAVVSINASSGRDATSVRTDSGGEERNGVNVPPANVSERNNTMRALNTNDETRKNISDQ